MASSLLFCIFQDNVPNSLNKLPQRSQKKSTFIVHPESAAGKNKETNVLESGYKKHYRTLKQWGDAFCLHAVL